MPSSSTHNTIVERTILENFRKSFLCLRYAPEQHAERPLTQLYSEVLDIPEDELNDRVRPTYDPELQTQWEYKAEKAEWDKWLDACKKAKHDACVFSAAECFRCVAFALSKAGRMQEAGRWYEMVEEVMKLASSG